MLYDGCNTILAITLTFLQEANLAVRFENLLRLKILVKTLRIL